jgi:hypothetical protein
MRDTRLIFVERLPGAGKTTTASWLASRLRSECLRVTLFLEHQPEHPLNVGGTLHPSGEITGEAFFLRYTALRFVRLQVLTVEALVQEFYDFYGL